jgi:hypothetical protein
MYSSRERGEYRGSGTDQERSADEERKGGGVYKYNKEEQHEREA